MELEDESDFALSCSSELHTSERCLEPMNEHLGYSLLYLMLATWAVNFIPIYVAAKMYHPDTKRIRAIE